MPTGTVKWFNVEKRFGFITPDEGGDDLFVHASQVADGEVLTDGDAVSFEAGQGQKGPRALKVTKKGVA